VSISTLASEKTNLEGWTKLVQVHPVGILWHLHRLKGEENY
jgi:hypothetical protein